MLHTCCGTSNHDRYIQVGFPHLSYYIDHFSETWRYQSTQTNDVHFFFYCRSYYVFSSHHHAKVYHLIIVACHVNPNYVLAYVMDIALHSSNQYLTFLAPTA